MINTVMINMMMINMVKMMKDLLWRGRAVIGPSKIDTWHGVVVAPKQLRECHIHKRSP